MGKTAVTLMLTRERVFRNDALQIERFIRSRLLVYQQQ